MDGNKSVVQMLESGNMPYRSFMFAVAGGSVVAPGLPSLDAGFRHPCRNDGFSGLAGLVYNDEISILGTQSLKLLLFFQMFKLYFLFTVMTC